MICRLCPRNCAQQRTDTQAGGRCGMPLLPVVSKVMLHKWEEPCLSVGAGSGAVFFAGCALGCVFCQNAVISCAPYKGQLATDAQGLVAIFEGMREQGAANINLVTAGHFLPEIIKALKQWHKLPVVYNCSGYEKVAAIRALEGLVDVYLPDIKYGDGPAAALYSNAPDYFDVARAAVSEMERQAGPLVVDEAGKAVRGLIVRHLLMPRGVGHARQVIDFAATLPQGTGFSLLRQYIPMGRAAAHAAINRRVTAREYALARTHLMDSGIEPVFLQAAQSATSEYVPDF